MEGVLQIYLNAGSTSDVYLKIKIQKLKAKYPSQPMHYSYYIHIVKEKATLMRNTINSDY